MKIGNNRFIFEVQDISGNYVPDLSASEFTIVAEVDGQTYDELDLTSFTENTISGSYTFNMNLANTGRGFVKVTPTDSTYTSIPTFYDVEVSTYDVDDIYAVINRGFSDVGTRSSNTTYVTKTVNTKEGDDATFTVATSEDISGWTNFKSTLVYSNTEVASGANVIGNLTIVATNVVAQTVDLKIPYTLTENIIQSGKTSRTVYADLQAEDTSGNRKTLSDITVNIKRQYTTT